jgi:hypothetical protein
MTEVLKALRVPILVCLLAAGLGMIPVSLPVLGGSGIVLEAAELVAVL